MVALIRLSRKTMSVKAPAAVLGGSKKGTRKGKWSIEEEEFTTRIIELFNSGLLELPEGTTLRSYLAAKLSCDPMRVLSAWRGRTTHCTRYLFFLLPHSRTEALFRVREHARETRRKRILQPWSA